MPQERSIQVSPPGMGGVAILGQFSAACSGGFSASKLSSIKRLALRRKVWYRALSRLERGIIDLTVQCVENIKSGKLANVVTAIVDKLSSAMENKLDRLVRSVGFGLAEKISAVATRLGNHQAAGWAMDAGFARYLAVAHLNSGRLG
jgi:hypothetical protein